MTGTRIDQMSGCGAAAAASADGCTCAGDVVAPVEGVGYVDYVGLGPEAEVLEGCVHDAWSVRESEDRLWIGLLCHCALR